MNIKKLEGINNLASSLSVEQIKNLSDQEILSMVMQRPGHPGQKGFMLQPRYFKSNKHFSEITYALMERLRKIENSST